MRVRQAVRCAPDPGREARIALATHRGAARCASTWGLARWQEANARGTPIPAAVDLHQDRHPWQRANAPWWVKGSTCALRRHAGIGSGPSAPGGRVGPPSPASRARRPWRTPQRGAPAVSRGHAPARAAPSHRHGPHQGADG
jgi:hypothetical protein